MTVVLCKHIYIRGNNDEVIGFGLILLDCPSPTDYHGSAYFCALPPICLAGLLLLLESITCKRYPVYLEDKRAPDVAARLP